MDFYVMLKQFIRAAELRIGFLISRKADIASLRLLHDTLNKTELQMEFDQIARATLKLSEVFRGVLKLVFIRTCSTCREEREYYYTFL
jgi:hypothetical protein